MGINQEFYWTVHCIDCGEQYAPDDIDDIQEDILYLEARAEEDGWEIEDDENILCPDCIELRKKEGGVK